MALSMARLFWAAAIVWAQLAHGQSQSTFQPVLGRPQVAFVYVSSYVDGKSGQIHAFAADSKGKLSLVQELNVPTAVWGLANNGKYVFSTDTAHIYSYFPAANGAIEKVSSIDALKFNKNHCGSVTPLFPDGSGASLYDLDYNFDCAGNTAYQFFHIDESTGKLSYAGVTNTSSSWWGGRLSFLANDKYAYQANCISDEYWVIYGFERDAHGDLVQLDYHFPTPTPKHGDFYCPSLTTADRTNHVAMSVQAVNKNFQNDGLPQLATYSADSSGGLLTRSTYRNMPTTANQYVKDIQISPSGKLLAVSGSAGLQVFHFNGGNPITDYTGLLTTDEVDQCLWDDDNHLYAVSSQAGKLFVYSVTPAGFNEAPGSPYTIDKPQFISVLAKK